MDEKELELRLKLLEKEVEYLSLKRNPPHFCDPSDYRYLSKYLERLENEIQTLTQRLEARSRSKD